ncbi:MAG: LysM peptidoglycan-binding domain-containing protein [Planctomycetota bacterium]
MARETKVGLLIGLAVILLVGIIVSDHLSVTQSDPTLGNPNPLVQLGQHTPTHQPVEQLLGPGPATPTNAAPVPTADEIDRVHARRLLTTTTTTTAANPLLPQPSRATLTRVTQPSPTPNPVPSITLGDPVQTSRAMPAPPATRDPLGPPPVVPIADRDQDTLPIAPTLATHTLPNANRLYTVQARETLRTIATNIYGHPDYWRVIAENNPQTVGPNGEVVAGTQLLIASKRQTPLPPQHADARRRAIPTVDNPNPASVTTLRPKTITVQAGDTLSELSMKHLGTVRRMDDLLAMNDALLEGDPNNLRVGMKLRIPAQTTAPDAGTEVAATPSTPRPSSPDRDRIYTVQPGDNLTRIAERTLGDGAKFRLIYQANRDRLADEDDLRVGQTLVIPAS